MRPRAIVQAETLYLVAVGLLLATSILTWAPMVAAFGLGLSLGATAFAVGLYLLLTLATTRRGSNVALWLLMLGTAFAVGSLFYQVATGQLAGGLVGVLNAAQAVLMLVGAVLLFRPAARGWFAAPREGEVDGGEEAEEVA